MVQMNPQTGTLCHMLYRAPGNILDWMYTRAGIKFSYVAHLRDTGTVCPFLPLPRMSLIVSRSMGSPSLRVKFAL